MGRAKPVTQNVAPPPAKRVSAPAASEICDEAVALLKRAPANVFLFYYLGSFPFWLAFLYFWADMARDPYAATRSITASLAVALLLVWMKTCHALSAAHLYDTLVSRPQEPLRPGRLIRIAVWQAFLHGTAVIVVPAALLVTIPLGFVLAYYQNATVLGGDRDLPALGRLHARASRQTGVWIKQNHLLLAVFLLFAGAVFLNLVALAWAIPFLLRTLTGTETLFSISALDLFNTTFFLIVLALTHVCVDPFLKAAYLLRCFYGESLETAVDLRVELSSRRAASARQSGKVAAAAAAFVFLVAPSVLPAQSPRGLFPAPARHVLSGSPSPFTHLLTPASVSADRLERKMNKVLERREFRWRLPREESALQPRPKGWLESFLQDLAATLRELAKDLFELVAEVYDWFHQWIYGKSKASPGANPSFQMNWAVTAKFLIVLLSIFVACVVAVWVYRTLVRRRMSSEIVAQALPRVPDITREDVRADELPEDEWVTLARDYVERGDLRLAMRALYLASLATLVRRGLISVARFKSNRDYEREMRRRSHAQPHLVEAFARNVAIFDRSWYGLHEVTPDLLDRFSANLRTLQAEDKPRA